MFIFCKNRFPGRIIAGLLVCLYLFASSGITYVFSYQLSLPENTIFTKKSLCLDSSIGTIIDEYNTDSDKSIIIIEDVHCNRKVQERIFNTLNVIKGECEDSFHNIGIEGAWDTINPFLLMAIPSGYGIIEPIIDELMSIGVLSGAEKYKTINPDVNLYGIEKKDAYKDNFKHLIEAEVYYQGAIQSLKCLMRELSANSDNVLSQKNREIEFYENRYSSGKIGFRELINAIKYGFDENNVDERNYPELKKSLLIYEKQKKLPLESLIMSEASSIRSYLKNILPFKDQEKLSNNETNTSYYTSLASLVKKYRINIKERFASLYSYFEYLDLYNSLNHVALLQEYESYLYKMKIYHSASENEEKYIFLKYYLNKASDIIENKASIQTVEDFLANEKRLWETINSLKLNKASVKVVRKQINLMKRFYSSVSKRNEFIIKNSLSAGNVNNRKDVSVIIIGGYHTNGLTNSLRNMGISYRVIRPSMVNAGNDSEIYRSRIKAQTGLLINSLSLDAMNIIPLFQALALDEEDISRQREMVEGVLKETGINNYIAAMGWSDLTSIDGVQKKTDLAAIWLALIAKKMDEAGYTQKDAKDFFLKMNEILQTMNSSYQIKMREVEVVFETENFERGIALAQFSKKDEIIERLDKRIAMLKEEDGFTRDIKEKLKSDLRLFSRDRLMKLYRDLKVDAALLVEKPSVRRWNGVRKKAGAIKAQDKGLNLDDIEAGSVFFEQWDSEALKLIKQNYVLNEYSAKDFLRLQGKTLLHQGMVNEMTNLFEGSTIKFIVPELVGNGVEVETAQIWVKGPNIGLKGNTVYITERALATLELDKMRRSKDSFNRSLREMREHEDIDFTLLSILEKRSRSESTSALENHLNDLVGESAKNEIMEKINHGTLYSTHYTAMRYSGRKFKKYRHFIASGFRFLIGKRLGKMPKEKRGVLEKLDLATLEELEVRLNAEQKQAGSANFRDQHFISDIHGAAGKFLFDLCAILELEELEEVKELRLAIDEEKKHLINDADISEKLPHIIHEQIQKKGITLRKLLKKKIEIIEKKNIDDSVLIDKIAEYYSDLDIFFLGDIGDRGPYGLEVFKILKELKDFGLLRSAITGNHDFWMMLNLNGWHLPFYEGYDFYERKVSRVRFYKDYGEGHPKRLFTKELRDFLMEREIVKKDKVNPNLVYLAMDVSDKDIMDIIFKERDLKDANGKLLTGEAVLKWFEVFSAEEKTQIAQLGGNTESVRKNWWRGKLDEYNKEQDELQKRMDFIFKNIKEGEKVSYKDVALRVKDLYGDINKKITAEIKRKEEELKNLEQELKDMEQNTPEIIEQKRQAIQEKKDEIVSLNKFWEPALKLLNDLRGNYFNTDVNAGFRAVGRMSVEWWEDRQMELEEMMAEYKDYIDLNNYAWEEIKGYMAHATDLMRDRKKEKTDSLKHTGQDILAYRAFNAIMNRNYESSEWWALDWSWHGGWGPTFMAELDKMSGLKKGETNGSNYMRSQEFKEMAEFSKKNFTLYSFTSQGDLLTHSALPIETDKKSPYYGTVVFTYKGEVYAGKRIFEGLDKIQDTIRNADLSTSKGFDDVREAANLVNSWYADATTIFKSKHLMAYREIGWRNILDSIGVTGRWLQGHNDFWQKFNPEGLEMCDQDAVVFLDHGLGPMYEYVGGSIGICYSRALYKFVRRFGRETTKELLDKGILSKEAGMKGEEYLLLNNRERPADIDGGLWERICGFFDNTEESFFVLGFETKDSIRPKRNPNITPKKSKGETIKLKTRSSHVDAEGAYVTKNVAVKRKDLLTERKNLVMKMIAELSDDPLDIWQVIIENFGEGILKAKGKYDKKDVEISDIIEKRLKFGTDEWRGTIGSDFNPLNAAIMFYAIGKYLKEKDGGFPEDEYFLIGVDTRKGGYETAKIGARILAGFGIKTIIPEADDVYSTTPQLAYHINNDRISIAGRDYKIGLGAVITARHSKHDINGISLFSNKGQIPVDAMRGEVIKNVQSFSEQIKSKKGFGEIVAFEEGITDGVIKTFSADDILDDYVEYCKDEVSETLGSEPKLKELDMPLFDNMHGAMYRTAIAFLKSMGLTEEKAKRRILHGSSDIPAGYYPNPTEINTGALCLWSCANDMTLIVGNSEIEMHNLSYDDIERLMYGEEIIVKGVKLSFRISGAAGFWDRKNNAQKVLKDLLKGNKVSVLVNGGNVELSAKMIESDVQNLYIAFNSDATRVGFVQKGRYVDFNETAVFLAYGNILNILDDLKTAKTQGKLAEFKHKYHKLITGDKLKIQLGRTIASSHGLDKVVDFFKEGNGKDVVSEACKDTGIYIDFVCEETEVGFAALAGLMDESILCMESSGHMGLNAQTWDDAFLTGIKLWGLMKKNKISDLDKRCKEVLKLIGYEAYFMEEIKEFTGKASNFESIKEKISDKKKIEDEFGEILKANMLSSYFIIDQDDKHAQLDGIRLSFNNNSAWLLIRPSGTENSIRIYAEAQTEAERDLLLQFGLKIIDREQYKAFPEACLRYLIEKEEYKNFADTINILREKRLESTVLLNILRGLQSGKITHAEVDNISELANNTILRVVLNNAPEVFSENILAALGAVSVMFEGLKPNLLSQHQISDLESDKFARIMQAA
ncbi:MAG: hypothetical protein ABH857_04700 [Elusimicrobiota bacterium]